MRKICLLKRNLIQFFVMPTWDAKQYLRFNDQRMRPCRELAARIAIEAPDRVIDLGCGPGNSASVLAERWPESVLTGLDSSPEMIAAAHKAYPQRTWRVGGITAWASSDQQTYDIVFSNAALQWVDDHAALFPKLMARVAKGGALAIQMPVNFDAPACRIMRDLAASQAWRDHFPANGVREWHVHDLAAYHDILAPIAAAVDFWQTEYLHVMENAAAIVEWYKGTGLRPFLDVLANDQQKAGFTAQYLERIERAYPVRKDGRVIFPFRRLFLIAYQQPLSPKLHPV
jgi:trans-aconitate 2-methyltransferase